MTEPYAVPLAPASILVSAGRSAHAPGAPVGPPVELSATYVADGPHSYGREGNATWSAFEGALGALEHGRALVFSSGMAAISAVLSLVPTGGLVVAPHHAYSGTGGLLDELESAELLRVRRVDVSDTRAVLAALDEAALLWLESPTNPMLELAELDVLLSAAADCGAIACCDNTFATPLGQQPLDLGADLVVHSVTKYLAGHSDVVLGATVSAEHPRGRELHDRLQRHRHLHGAVAGPVETWLALRGLRTLHLRVERSTTNAVTLAARLEDHPAVRRVRYPGRGGIIAIEVAGGAQGAEAVAGAVRLWVHATSLGGIESLIERRRRHVGEAHSVPAELLRLSVGVEDVDDLWRDLDQALEHTAYATNAANRPETPRAPA